VHPARLIFVEQLAVDAEHHRRGIGRALMAAVEALAREDGRDLHMGVRAFNAAALRFHERLGYRPVDLRLARAPVQGGG
jgi:ribosomal protein S18 acetylase RimI-like enzyme